MAIIAISRGTDRGGLAVAEAVARSLGYPCVGREMVAKAAATLGVSADIVDVKLARAPGWWDRIRAEREVYLAALRNALAERIATGEFVYHSYAGHLCRLRAGCGAPPPSLQSRWLSC